jgi:hypothetical protein
LDCGCADRQVVGEALPVQDSPGGGDKLAQFFLGNGDGNGVTWCILTGHLSSLSLNENMIMTL